MAEISGKFKLAVADDDNFDQIMAAAGNVIFAHFCHNFITSSFEIAGVPDEKRARGRAIKPTIQFTCDGGNYKMTYATDDGRELTHTFQLDVELDETTLDGRKVKVRYYWLIIYIRKKITGFSKKAKRS